MKIKEFLEVFQIGTRVYIDDLKIPIFKAEAIQKFGDREIEKVITYYDCSLKIETKSATEERKKTWVRKWYKAYYENNNVNHEELDNQDIMVYSWTKGRNKVGIARCNKSIDIFDERTGIAVAYARYCGESIPEYI